MAKKNTNQETQNFENVENALTHAESFIEKNQKKLSYVLLAIIVAVFGYFGFKKFISQPKSEAAIEEIFLAERYFEQDSFRLALQGDGINYGFLDIIDNYKRTPAGNLSYYYAGACYLHLGEFDAAVKYLQNYNPEDLVLGASAQAMMGDAYVEMDDFKNAIKHYEKAEKTVDNDFLSPVYLMKAGQAYELDGQLEKALEVYTRIETEYYDTREQRNVEKYKARVEMQLK